MYKVKKEGETIAVAGIAQSFSGLVEDDLYKLIIKADPKLKDKFEKVDQEITMGGSALAKSLQENQPEAVDKSAPLSDNA